jgi:exopolysaccharide production protein ExoQ
VRVAGLSARLAGRVHAGYILGIAAFAFVPLAVISPKGEVVLLAFAALPLLARTASAHSWKATLRTPLAGILAALLAWSLASSAWSIAPLASLGLWKSLALIALAAMILIRAGALLRVAHTDVLESMAPAGLFLGLALLAFELAGDLLRNRAVRGLAAGDPALLPSILNAGISVAILFLWPTLLLLWRRGRRWLCLAALLATTAIVVAGESDAARLVLAVSTIVFAVVLWAGPRATWVSAVLVAVGIVAAPLLPHTVLAPGRVLAALPNLGASGIHRVFVWDFAARRIAERPLTGWGLHTSRVVPVAPELLKEHAELMPLHPHNAALQAWLELGLPGAAAFAALVVLALAWATRLARAAQAGAVAVIVAALGFGSLSFGLWQNWWLATLALAAALTAAATRSDRVTEELRS